MVYRGPGAGRSTDNRCPSKFRQSKKCPNLDTTTVTHADLTESDRAQRASLKAILAHAYCPNPAHISAAPQHGNPSVRSSGLSGKSPPDMQRLSQAIGSSTHCVLSFGHCAAIRLALSPRRHTLRRSGRFSLAGGMTDDFRERWFGIMTSTKRKCPNFSRILPKFFWSSKSLTIA